MTDTFFLGAGFSQAICPDMPSMTELFELIEPMIEEIDGLTRDAYQYAAGNVETLLSYYAMPNPHDDHIELLRKQRVTAQLEKGIGAFIQTREAQEAANGLNPNGARLVSAWHTQRSHVLTTNYDTLVERLAKEHEYLNRSGSTSTLDFEDIYPIPVTNARSRAGGGLFFPAYPETFAYYKLHGSVSWFKSVGDTQSDPINGLSFDALNNPRDRIFVTDTRRFIVPPVYDKSSLLFHESIRNLWWQAKNNALKPADNLYVIGYSLPETDAAMHVLLWEGSVNERRGNAQRKSLFVIDRDDSVAQRYFDKLGPYYDVIDGYAGGDDAFDRFVDDYIAGA